jgi:drug/metabolite transporter superfamily protein YnfA
MVGGSFYNELGLPANSQPPLLLIGFILLLSYALLAKLGSKSAETSSYPSGGIRDAGKKKLIVHGVYALAVVVVITGLTFREINGSVSTSTRIAAAAAGAFTLATIAAIFWVSYTRPRRAALFGIIAVVLGIVFLLLALLL